MNTVLILKNGIFVSGDGVVSPCKAVNDGWNVKIISGNGVKKLIAETKENGVLLTVSIDLGNGYHRTVRKDEKGSRVVKQGFFVNKGEPVDGKLFLTTGCLADRHVYFHAEKYERFLEENRIHAVRYADPNRMQYPGEKVYTDGIVCSNSGSNMIRNATWVYDAVTCNLYTQVKNVFSLNLNSESWRQ